MRFTLIQCSSGQAFVVPEMKNSVVKCEDKFKVHPGVTLTASLQMCYDIVSAAED